MYLENLAAYAGSLYFYHTELFLKCRFGGSTPSCLFSMVSFAPFATFKTFNLY